MSNFGNQFETRQGLYIYLLSADLDEIQTLCTLNTITASICADPTFWKTKAANDFGVNLDTYESDPANATNREKYLLLYTRRVRCVRGSERYFPKSVCADNAAQRNDLKLINYFMSKGAPARNVYYGAATVGNLDLVKQFEPQIATYPDLEHIYRVAGMRAARNNRRNVVDYLIPKVTEMVGIEIVNGAIRGRHLDLVKHLIEELHIELSLYNLQVAANVGFEPILKYILDTINVGRTASSTYSSSKLYNQVLLGAARANNLELLKRTIAAGATRYDDAFIASIRVGRSLTLGRSIVADYLLRYVNTNQILDSIVGMGEIDPLPIKYLLSLPIGQRPTNIQSVYDLYIRDQLDPDNDESGVETIANMLVEAGAVP